MKPKNKKLRIGLLVEGANVTGGIQSASARHLKLLQDSFEIVPIAFENSKSEKDWAGKLEPVKDFGAEAYLIVASDFKTDNRWSENASIENIRHDLRYRAFADHLIHLIEEKELDLLHAFGLFHQRGMIAAYAAAKCGVPFMVSFRGVDLETRVFDRALPQVQVPLLSAQSVVCVSEDSRRLVLEMFQPKCPVHVIRNHFDPALFKERKLKIPLLEGNTLPVIGCFGNFRRVMGFDFLLEAFDRVNERKPAVLLLVGSIQKREVEYYNSMLEKMKSAGNMIRIGNVQHSSILNYAQLCDLMVYPSISDASPNKILEAMYAKVPVVSTSVGGIPELVSHEKEALLVPPRDAGALAAAMERILSDQELIASLTQAAHARVTGELRIENERPLWEQVYQDSYDSYRAGRR